MKARLDDELQRAELTRGIEFAPKVTRKWGIGFSTGQHRALSEEDRVVQTKNAASCSLAALNRLGCGGALQPLEHRFRVHGICVRRYELQGGGS